MKITICATYYAGTVGNIELPEGRAFDDIGEWFIKWDTFHATFKDGTEFDCPMNSETDEIIDWKRPIDATVYGYEKDGDPDWDEELDSYSG